MVPSSMDTTRVRPVLVVPSMRSPAITAVDPVMMILFASKSTSGRRKFQHTKLAADASCHLRTTTTGNQGDPRLFTGSAGAA